jgi:asparagine synthase (glutamine-hydrolysing)
MSKDGRYYVVYDGEIYNYRELRKELEGLGCQFHSQSDIEVLRVVYEQWGVDALRRCIGRFVVLSLSTTARCPTVSRSPPN